MWIFPEAQDPRESTLLDVHKAQSGIARLSVSSEGYRVITIGFEVMETLPDLIVAPDQQISEVLIELPTGFTHLVEKLTDFQLMNEDRLTITMNLNRPNYPGGCSRKSDPAVMATFAMRAPKSRLLTSLVGSVNGLSAALSAMEFAFDCLTAAAVRPSFGSGGLAALPVLLAVLLTLGLSMHLRCEAEGFHHLALLKSELSHRIKLFDVDVRGYVVLCHGHVQPVPGVLRISARIREGAVRGRSTFGERCRTDPRGKPALTKVSVLGHQRRDAREEALSLVGISILTGRQHQIRVHLQHVGHPTVYDARYLEPSVLLQGLELRDVLRAPADCPAPRPLPERHRSELSLRGAYL
ncbi:unnamed protein product [Polarella glacialis]|uniref:Pseudouridine synthase RsuA/RluA-like domain-containing protein n=1 Tax=Polarella glacialis TaxID=89957 RepID=A0A813E5C8_POLGL|nr:unnamed protein product [Polarella glacialis]